MDKVLLYLKSSIIQSFSLFITKSFNNHHVDKWLYNIINRIRKVKKLYIISMTTQDLATHIFPLEFPILREMGVDQCMIFLLELRSPPLFIFHPSLSSSCPQSCLSFTLLRILDDERQTKVGTIILERKSTISRIGNSKGNEGRCLVLSLE